MPIYEYRCQSCGLRFELIQKFDAAPPSGCRECDGPVEKLISQSAFKLKGSGWYVTDYAGKKADSSDSKDGSSPSGKSSESGLEGG